MQAEICFFITLLISPRSFREEMQSGRGGNFQNGRVRLCSVACGDDPSCVFSLCARHQRRDPWGAPCGTRTPEVKPTRETK